MIGCARPSFQREARGDARFSVATQCSAPHCRAMQGIANQSNADRSLATCSFPGRFGPKAERGNARQITDPQGSAVQSNADRSLATGSFPGRFGPNGRRRGALQISALHRTARNRRAAKCHAWHRNPKQRGSELGNRLFSGPLWSKRMAAQCKAMQGIAWQRMAFQSNADRSLATGSFPGRFGPKAAQEAAVQISASMGEASHRIEPPSTAMQGNAFQSNADWSLATGFLPGRFGPNATHGVARNCAAAHRKSAHSTSKQRGLPTGNSWFSGLFCPSGRVSPAALSTD